MQLVYFIREGAQVWIGFGYALVLLWICFGFNLVLVWIQIRSPFT